MINEAIVFRAFHDSLVFSSISRNILLEVIKTSLMLGQQEIVSTSKTSWLGVRCGPKALMWFISTFLWSQWSTLFVQFQQVFYWQMFLVSLTQLVTFQLSVQFSSHTRKFFLIQTLLCKGWYFLLLIFHYPAQQAIMVLSRVSRTVQKCWHRVVYISNANYLMFLLVHTLF